MAVKGSHVTEYIRTTILSSIVCTKCTKWMHNGEIHVYPHILSPELLHWILMKFGTGVYTKNCEGKINVFNVFN
jgi:hypothetical protein